MTLITSNNVGKMMPKRSLFLLFTLNHWVSGLLFIAITTLLVSKKAYSIALGLLAITAIIVFVYQLINDRKTILTPFAWQEDSGKIIATFLLFLCTSLFFYVYHNEPLRFLDKPLKLILFALLLLLLLRHCCRAKVTFISIALAAILAGGIAVYEVYILSASRALTEMMATQTGGIAMSLGLFSCLIAVYAARAGNNKLLSLAILGATAGIIASFLSGTRGAWVCLPLLGIYFLYHYRRRFSLRTAYIGLIIGGLSVIFLDLNPTVTSRFQAVASDITQYQNEQKGTSIGYRFELWKSAADAWQDKPLLGWGNPAIVKERQSQEQNGQIIEGLSETNFHAHNQFLEELSIRGLLGLLVFLIFLLIPFRVFAKYRHHQQAKTRLFSHLGMLHIFLISTYCLTQAFFAHNSGMMFYALMVVVFYAALHHSLANTHVEEGQKQ